MEREDELRPKKGIKFIDEILEEVGDIEGLSKEEMDEIWKIHKMYVRQLMEDEEVDYIAFPQIGNLYYNIFFEKSKRLKSKNNREETERSKRIRSEIDRKRSLEKKTNYQFPQNKKGVLMKQFNNIMVRFFGRNKKYTNFKNAIKHLEDYANGKFTE